MHITEWESKDLGERKEISANVGDFRLWYRLPKSYPVSHAGDPFLAAALLPAMAKGKALEVDPALPVSPKLLENAELLQDIHHCWNPGLKKIVISAKTSPAEPLSAGAFSFFSGGVDSTFTFLRREKDISHVVFVHGFDFFLDDAISQAAVLRNASFVQGYGKALIPITTNYFLFGYHHNLSRVLTQGSTLASVALLLGFPRAYVPATDHYSYLMPLGSHPLTDPLYSNEAVQIIHDGAGTRRIDKVKKIAECDPALANLRVCTVDMNVNCGTCVKCLRTAISLRLLGVSAAPFPPLHVKAIKRMNWAREPRFFNENRDLAVQSGDKELRDVLSATARKYERTRLFKEVDRVLLGGLIKRTYRRVAKGPPTVRRISTTPASD